jgi:hypothetical protein
MDDHIILIIKKLLRPPNTDNKINRFVTSFATYSCIQDNFVTGDKPGPRHCNAKKLYALTYASFASILYRDTRNAQPALYLDGKTCAPVSLRSSGHGIPSLHRDYFPANPDESGLPGAASGNSY